MHWASCRDADSLIQYLNLEEDVQKRSDACFMQLCDGLAGIAEAKYFTDDQRAAVAHPYCAQKVQEDMAKAAAMIRQHAGSSKTISVAFIHNTALSRIYAGAENRGLFLELAVARMASIEEHFGDMLSQYDREIGIAFLLRKLGEKNDYAPPTERSWHHMLDVAKTFAQKRTFGRLTQAEMVRLRDELIISAPHYARVIQEEIVPQ